MPNTFGDTLTDYILSGHAFLQVHTPEKTRFCSELKTIAAKLPPDGRPIYTWSAATGWQDSDGQPAALPDSTPGPPSPQSVPQQIVQLPENAVFVLKDFGTYVQLKSYPYADLVIAWLSEIRDVLANSGRTVIFLGVDFEIPALLSHDITTLEFPLPDEPAIERAVRFIAEDVGVEEPHLPTILRACRGMTQQQVEDRTALALRRFKKLGEQAAQLILHEKAEVIRRTGLLEYRDPPEGGLDRIGGWEHVKQHVALDKPCLSPEARAFGLEPPRGLLLVGIPGGGKTQMSLCIASYLGLPLIQMDVGSLMSKWVGESERNMREAIRLLEGLGACVLQLDEIEKGFGGVGSEDGGAARRSFGIFLKWLSDRTSPVYVVATANAIQCLPPEFSRKGRFDEIYGIYPPSHAEREAILGIHLRLRGRKPESFDLQAIAQRSEGYTGADLKEVVQMALKCAFAQGQQLTTDHLLAAVPEVRPLVKTDPESVAAVLRWLDVHAKPASPQGPAIPTNGTLRKRRVTMN